jgi:hypothetical protein
MPDDKDGGRMDGRALNGSPVPDLFVEPEGTCEQGREGDKQDARYEPPIDVSAVPK